MRLKSFTARNLPEAMERVRERLGPDAVILQQQELEDGGVRVTAALESAPAPAGPFSGVEGLDAFTALSEALDYHRLPVGLTDRLLAATGAVEADTPILALAAGLDSVIPFGTLPSEPLAQPLMLMGPPGAGKTATAAKLAAHARVRGAEATLITLDVGKAGGLAQISAFADALGAELREARDAESLRDAVSKVDKGRLVLIDTLGHSPYDGDGLREIGEWIEAANAKGVLVMPAGGDPIESAEVAMTYAHAGAQRMIATKLDATRRLGGILAAAHASELALMGVGVSATIGGGLRGINPMQLARLILPETEADDGDPMTESSNNDTTDADEPDGTAGGPTLAQGAHA